LDINTLGSKVALAYLVTMPDPRDIVSGTLTDIVTRGASTGRTVAWDSLPEMVALVTVAPLLIRAAAPTSGYAGVRPLM
jgi:hypothetical protein